VTNIYTPEVHKIGKTAPLIHLLPERRYSLENGFQILMGKASAYPR
jgi:hypothetical protein